ncbi:MAG: L,D-transpeptidase [Hyphomicrobium sp.]|nr:L,D-transpeptidase [Hyphomicrobium sp.]PPC82420.1 MAG: L,D-transpeptidase [Hyphomicrobium sp.]
MPSSHVFSRLVFNRIAASVAAVLAIGTLVTGANAQQSSSLWGGSAEWGGGRQTVKFSPTYKTGQVIVSFGDRRLYLVTATGQALSYPIAVPREQSRWQGVTSVSQKRENPAWTPTPTMIAENPRLPRWVPGGHPMNPLGVRALYLGSSAYRIHGTDAPWTIGQAVSKGCIRMYNQDVIDLYPRVPLGSRVTVTWQRFQSGPALADAPQAPTNQQNASYSGGASQAASSGFSLFGSSEEELRAERIERARAAADLRRANTEKRRQVIKRYTNTRTTSAGRQSAVE